jgi:hypothetical protein
LSEIQDNSYPFASEQRTQFLPYCQNEEVISSDRFPLGAKEKKTKTGVLMEEASSEENRVLGWGSVEGPAAAMAGALILSVNGTAQAILRSTMKPKEV